MASDVYVSIEGIKGESTDSRHQGWIECEGVEWGMVQPRSSSVSTSGGHTAERVEIEDVTFIKHADFSTPILMQTCAMGKTIPRAKFEFMRADGNGEAIKYFEMELENVMISFIQPAIRKGEILSEHIGLKFSKIKWKYSQQKIGGGVGGNTAGGWDLAGNKVV